MVDSIKELCYPINKSNLFMGGQNYEPKPLRNPRPKQQVR